MLKNKNLVALGLLLSISCRNFNFMNEENPRKASFKYYSGKFKIDPLSTLKINRKYYLNSKVSKSIDVLIFFNDGFINNIVTNDIENIDCERSESGVIMGYYITKKDSIFFTTKSYYQHRATSYKGKINNDTLDLEVKYPGNKKVVQEKYILYP